MNYDPLAATVIRLGLPGGDDFFTEHAAPIRLVYGDEIADAFCEAVRENDLDAAERFASLAAPGYAYEISDASPDFVEVSYSAPGAVTGTCKISIHPESAAGPYPLHPTVLAVLSTSERVMRMTKGYPAPVPGA